MKTPRILAALTLIVGIILSSSTLAHTGGGLVVKDAWVREAPANAKVMAAYMKIENHTDKDRTLVSVSSSAFDRIEIHDTVEKDGMATMVQQHKLPIKAQGELLLQPNGMHFMLFNPKKALKAGDSVTFTLKFANGSTAMTNAKVKKVKGSGHHHEHHDHHDSHQQHQETDHGSHGKHQSIDDQSQQKQHDHGHHHHQH